MPSVKYHLNNSINNPKQKIHRNILHVRNIYDRIKNGINFLCQKKGAYPFSFCNRKPVRAVITIEAALILPLFIAAVFSLQFFMEVYRIKADVMRAMQDAGREIVRYGYIYEAAEENQEIGNKLLKRMSALAASNLIIKNRIEKYLDTAEENHIQNLSVIKNDFFNEQGMLDVVVHYNIRVPFSLLGEQKIPVSQRVYMHHWVGFLQEDESQVYITKSGQVYHRKLTCPYLKLSIKEILFYRIQYQRNASGGRYKPCAICGSRIQGKYCYITDYGDSYHTTLSCSGLKRGIITIPISKVGNRRECSKCGGKND